MSAVFQFMITKARCFLEFISAETAGYTAKTQQRGHWATAKFDLKLCRTITNYRKTIAGRMPIMSSLYNGVGLGFVFRELSAKELSAITKCDLQNLQNAEK